MLFERADVGSTVGGDGLGCERGGQLLEALLGLGIGEVPRDIVEDGRRTEAVEGVGREDEVPLVGDALGHLAAGGANALDIGVSR